MNKLKSWKKISKLGIYFRKKIKEISKKNNIDLELGGLLAIPSFVFKNDKKNILKTFITQEMLKNGYIINNAAYLCISHNIKILDQFFKVFNKILKI